jgi:hypothetical protein
MGRKNMKKESGEMARARVKKEMAKPRITKSARIAELNLDTSRIGVRAVRKETKAISDR